MRRYYQIDYVAAKENNISLMEWVILENISFFQARYGECTVSKVELAEFHEISDRMYRKYIAKLKEKKLVKDTKNGIKCTKKWFDILSFSDRNKSSADTGTKVPHHPIKKEYTVRYTDREKKEKDKKEKKVFKNPELEAAIRDAKEVADHLLQKIKTIKPNFADTGCDLWVRDIADAIRFDNRTKDELMSCIDWMYSTKVGSFWVPVVISGRKLREKFDQMEMQKMRSDANSLDHALDDVERMVEEFERRRSV